MSEHLYIHIPFCLRKCGYCDFYSLETTGRLPEFVSALIREIGIRASREKRSGSRIETIYFGGGTPSLLPLADLEAILEAIHSLYAVSPHAEITLEANPGTVGPGYFSGIRRLGINRLSLGIQSFNPDKLNFLGRIHTCAEGRLAIDQAQKAGFDNIGLDLIYGGPGESARDWRQELAAACGFQPGHLSCYMLTLEQGTPLYHRCQAGDFSPMTSSGKVDLFLIASHTLEDAGFSHYEISNFAEGPHRVSRHNSAYWLMKPYTGFGPSAHSFFHGRDPDGSERPARSWNVSDLESYIRLIEKGKLPVAEQEILTPAQQMTELVMVGLRTRSGVDLGLFDALSEVPFKKRFSGFVTGLETGGMGAFSACGGYFALTRKGWTRLDNIVESFAGEIL